MIITLIVSYCDIIAIMENTLLVQHDLTPVISLVTNSVTSPHTKRAYRRSLNEFLEWYWKSGYTTLSKASVNAYKAHLLEKGRGLASINQALTAIRKLAVEAADNGLLDPNLANGIERVKGITQSGQRAGNWLTKEEAEKLIATPLRQYNSGENSLSKALRDQAILAVMLGTALRRSEVAKLEWGHIQQRDGRWAIIDLKGKRNRTRSVGIPAWVKVALDSWQTVFGLTSGRVFRALNKDGDLSGAVKTKKGYFTDGNVTAQAVYNVVVEYSIIAGFVDGDGNSTIAAHDLRRTAAGLALKGGASLRQIQEMLGHSSVQTTEKYLKPLKNLQETASDFIQIEIEIGVL